MNSALIISLLAVFASAQEDTTSWNGLYATWTIYPNKGFDQLPRQLSENKDFVLKDDQCALANAKFRGIRYWSNQDPALILLFDKNGIIAGLQSSIPVGKYTPPATAKGFVADGDYWTQTVYFVDPSTICTKGRTKEDLEKEGTGTGNWIQYGPDPTKDLFDIPLDESEIKKTLWGNGKCVRTMGQHYWFNSTYDMNCDNFYPQCLLYNSGKLTGFCIAPLVSLESPWYDDPAPTNEAIKNTVELVPKCFYEDPKLEQLTSLHIYFHSEPRTTSTC